MNLKPCPYRLVDDTGQILCDRIKSGDREVSPNICRACPVSAINCAHLRATLDHQARPPITVHYGNGKTEVWDDPAPTIALERAACAAKVTPIHSPRDCAGCPLRQALVVADTIQTMAARPQVAGNRQPTTTRAPRVAPAPSAPPQPVTQTAQLAPAAEARSNIVAQKIIQLQEWLAKQKQIPAEKDEEENTVTPIANTARPRIVREEKRVGWTD